MPFYYVQIAPYAYSKQKGQVPYTDESEPEFWEAQALAMQIPHTGMIASTDLNFDLDNLHPHYKWEIGKRLAICALANDYGKKELVPMGPLYDAMKITGSKIILHFKYTGKGLTSNNGQALTNFTVAGTDGRFVAAKAVIKNNEVEVSSDSVTVPVAVRFGWNEGAHANLYNKDGLPALPFRTDNPLVKKFN
jgi:sialate O-acetylesterase